MSALKALQGLFGGLSSGVGGLLENRDQEAQMAQRERQIAIQEQQTKREQQAQEFEQLKARYMALNPEQDIDAAAAQPFVSGGFTMMKGANGLRRAPTVPEQTNLAGINPAFIAQKATLEYAPMATEKALDRTQQASISAAELANRLKIAQSNDATQLAGARIGADSRIDAAEAQADAMRQRLYTNANLKEVKPAEFMLWKKTSWETPANTQAYDAALQRGVPKEMLDARLMDLYKKFRDGRPDSRNASPE